MFNEINIFLKNFFNTIRFADILDILIIAAFIYTFIIWLRRSASGRIIIAVGIFSVIYLLARLFDLYMTEVIIKYLFVVIIIASVIVFQADIRRFVELIGNWEIYKRTRRSKYSDDIIDTLTEAAFRMSEKKTGALIALKGRETWSRPVHGGINIGGKVSAPILYSIFNKYSPGHDGAVLIEGDTIEKFGAHLTLSTNQQELGHHGTRHAAALGLSENCDAIVIAVSEESGAVSIAERGKLYKVATGSELKKRISDFWDKHYSIREGALLQWWKTKSFQTIVISISLAVLSWFLFAYQSEIVYRTYLVPVEFRNLPENYSLEDPSALETRITLAGSEQAFRLLDPSALAVSLNLGNLEVGNNEFLVSESDLTLPSDIHLYDADPREIKIRGREMKEALVPVEVKTSGKIPGNRTLQDISVNPESVRLLVPEKSKAPAAIFTEPVDLNKITGSSTVSVRLVPPTGMRLPNDERRNVTVIINVE